MPRARLFVLLAVPVLLFVALARQPEPPRPASSKRSGALIARVGDSRFRHADLINGIAYRPDGMAIAATADRRPEVVEWSADGREVRRYLDPETPTRAVAILGYTPDSRRLILRVNHERVVTFDTATGAVVSRVEYSNVIRVAPDGVSVIGRSPTRRLTLWDVETGRAVREYPTDVYEDVSYSPDGRWVAAALHSEPIATVGEFGHIIYRARAWVGPVGGGAGHTFVLPQPVEGVGVHLAWVKPDRVFLAAGPQMATFDSATGERKALAPPPKDGLRQVWVTDGRMFIQHFGDLRAFEYDPDTLAPVPGGARADDPKPPPALSPDGRVRAAAHGYRVRLLDARTGDPLAAGSDWPLDSAAFAIRFSADGRRMLTAGLGVSHTFDATTLRVLAPLGNGRNSGGEFLSPDGRWAVGTDPSSDDRALVVWDADTGAEVFRQEKPADGRPRWHDLLGFDASGGVWALLRWGRDDFVRYDIPSGRVLQTIRGFDQTTYAALSPDGTRLVTGGWTAFALRSTDPRADWQVVARYPGRHQGGCGLDQPPSPEPIEFSPDGQKLLTGSGWWYNDKPQWKAQVWGVNGAPKSGVWLDAGRRPAFTPDGRHIVARAAGGLPQLRVTDADTGAERFRFDPEAEVSAFAFTPDGTRLVVAHTDTTLSVWDWASLSRGR